MNKFKKGDWVYYIPRGWGRVDKINKNPVSIFNVECFQASFTACGRLRRTDSNPLLYTYDPINGTEPPEVKIDWDNLPFGTEVIVGNTDDSKKLYLANFKQERTIYYIAEGSNKVSKALECTVTLLPCKE